MNENRRFRPNKGVPHVVEIYGIVDKNSQHPVQQLKKERV